MHLQEAVLALPLGEEGTLSDIQIHAGMASVYGPVTILKPFVLKGMYLPTYLPTYLFMSQWLNDAGNLTRGLW